MSDKCDSSNSDVTADEAEDDELTENLVKTTSTNNENTLVEIAAKFVAPNTNAGETNVVQIEQSAEPPPIDNEEVLINKEESIVSTVATSHDGDDEYSKHVTYEKDGTAIYTDPNTNFKYTFSEKENKWVLRSESGVESETKDPFENEHYRWCAETEQWIPKTGASDTTYGFEDGVHTYKDQDGTTFFYDAKKKAWFPKIDDEFMAIYQLNYGVDNAENQATLKLTKDDFKIPEISPKYKEIEISTPEENPKADDNKTQPKKRKAPAEPPKWFDLPQEQNTKVYVSNLPLDITETEFLELMGKCGMIMKDPQTQKFKIKLYVDSNGMLKGDGLCDYIKVESVELALNILDGSVLREKKIHVQRAKFQMRGEYNPTLKPKKKKKDKEKLAKLKEKLFDWRPEKMRGERSKHERVVIIKNLFEPEMFDKDVKLILEYQTDLREECSKCGKVRKILIYDRHVDGVASISMGSPEEADIVVQMMNRRFFGKRRLIAEIWDGKTKYKIDESENEEKNRLSNWDKYLHDEEKVKEENLTNNNALGVNSTKNIEEQKQLNNEKQLIETVDLKDVEEENLTNNNTLGANSTKIIEEQEKLSSEKQLIETLDLKDVHEKLEIESEKIVDEENYSQDNHILSQTEGQENDENSDKIII